MAFTLLSASSISGGVGDSLRPNKSNIIINGDMAVAQRGTSATGKTTGDIYTVDRMKILLDSLGTYTVAQESQTSGNAFANGFANAWRIDCTTANASPSASAQLGLQYTFEGQDLQVFKKGTANAEKFTLAFWVKSNKTGTGNIQLKDKDNSNRQCTQSYTISSADTWEHKVCVFGADTTGAFDDDNAKSLIINWYLGSGTDSSSGTANHGVWEAQDQTKVNDGGTLNIGDNTANDWSITGIQLEVGEYTSATLPPFQHESYGNNLARCQRYCQVYKTESAYGMMSPAGVSNTTTAFGIFTFPTYMRTIPSLSTSGSFGLYSGDGGDAVSSIVIDANSDDASRVVCTISGSGFTDNSSAFLRANNDSSAKMTFNAEL